MSESDYFATEIMGWTAIVCFLVYCLVWDLRFLTGAIGFLFIAILTKKATDWKKAEQAGR